MIARGCASRLRRGRPGATGGASTGTRATPRSLDTPLAGHDTVPRSTTLDPRQPRTGAPPMKRFVVQLALAAATAFAVAVAAPAYAACENCDCAKKSEKSAAGHDHGKGPAVEKKDAKPADKAPAAAPA